MRFSVTGVSQYGVHLAANVDLVIWPPLRPIAIARERVPRLRRSRRHLPQSHELSWKTTSAPGAVSLMHILTSPRGKPRLFHMRLFAPPALPQIEGPHREQSVRPTLGSGTVRLWPPAPCRAPLLEGGVPDVSGDRKTYDTIVDHTEVFLVGTGVDEQGVHIGE